MSASSRKPRPLQRDVSSLRDDRLFIVACDDTYAPKQYFGFFQIVRVKVHVVPTLDGTSAAPHVLDRLLAFDHDEDDELWLLLDTDHCIKGGHFSSFVLALEAARRRGVHVCLSKPSFEFWLLLHHREAGGLVALPNAAEVEKQLSATLGGYSKVRLRREHYPLDSVRAACVRAARLDATVTGGDNPTAKTTRVYQLWQAIVAKALPSQLPSELRGLFAP